MKEGDNVSMHCITAGNLFDIKWDFYGEVIIENMSRYTLYDEKAVLKITSIQVEDVGTYRCNVSNPLGSLAKEIWLAIGQQFKFDICEFYHFDTQ